MVRSDIQAQTTALFRELFDRPQLVLNDDMTAQDIEEWDSLNHLRLMHALEVRFKIKFTSAEIAWLKNVGELISLIERKSQRKS